MINTFQTVFGIACIAIGASQNAYALCPSSHLEPTVSYGSAFGSPEKITTAANFGLLSGNDELVFQYFEYQSRDLDGYDPVFGIHILYNPATKSARVFFGRIKGGNPIWLHASLSLRTVETIVAIAAPIIRNTRYRQVACDVVYTDGHLIQAGVNWQSVNTYQFIGGEAFAPLPGSEAARLQSLGHALRALATGKMRESEVEF